MFGYFYNPYCVANRGTQTYDTEDLQPFTSYNLRIQACTIIGCGTSDSTIASTLEASPEGITTPTLSSRTSTTLTIRIYPIFNPNGFVTYTLFARGVFNATIDQEVVMVVHSGVESGDVVVMDLLPFNSYTVYLDVNNTVGGIRSEEIIFETLGTVPEGFSAPTLINSTSNTLTVTWSQPSFPNGDIHTYLLYGESNEILSGPVSIVSTDNLVGSLTNLRPFTVYTVFVTAVNQYGNTTGDVALLTTLESVPEDLPAPTISDVQSRSVQLSWVPPSTPNGQLIQYIIIQNGVEISTVSSGTLESTIPLLTPFTQYSFAIEACTAVGCFRSDDVIVTTLEDGKLVYIISIVDKYVYCVLDFEVCDNPDTK
ncbi:usherin [Oopsacas minuta]|uniref:Usherin n=1 Tax=Oopsacas minuta TaxID=111878 RepID=A0AAV7JFN0_9METZ|nr:usherin [Oopsacas minuta]